ncbi:MAG TPA: AMP-dependent synthetase, partial [Dehalococcoidia bacterium]|nr:AMP-dependent synthetase [Dehalococcoidia bacterium]
AGLMDVLMPGWFHGCKVVATAMKGFDSEDAYRILAEHEVTLALLTPTMLKLMRQVDKPLDRYDLKLRAVLSGGEAVGAGLLEWAQAELNLAINEGFGQTECNVILGNNGNIFPIKPGSLGKPTPGTVVKIIDDEGLEVAPGV